MLLLHSKYSHVMEGQYVSVVLSLVSPPLVKTPLLGKNPE